MYNSIIINLIMAVVIKVQSLYRHSLIHKVVTKLKRFCRASYENSFFMNLLSKLSTYYNTSLIVNLSDKIVSIVDSVLKGLYKIKDKMFKNSQINKSLGMYTDNWKNLMELLLSIMIVSSLIMRILYEKGNLVLDVRIIVMSAVVGAAGLILLNLNRHIVTNSRIVQFIVSLYELDEGGHTWW